MKKCFICDKSTQNSVVGYLDKGLCDDCLYKVQYDLKLLHKEIEKVVDSGKNFDKREKEI